MIVKLIILILLIVSCGGKVAIHELVGKKELTYRLMLVETEDVDRALQKIAFERLGEIIEDPPADVKVKLKLTKKDVKLIRKEPVIVSFFDFDTLEALEDTNLVIGMEVKEVSYTERKYVTKDEEEEVKYKCVERQAEAVVLFNVVNPATRDVYFARTYKGKFYKRYCDEKTYRPDLLPKEDFVKLKAIEDAIKSFVRDFYDLL